LVRRLRSFACERSAAFRYEKPLLPPAPPAVLSSLREEARALWALYGVMTRGRSAGAARGPWHACLGRQIALAAKARRRRLRRMRSRWRRRQDSRRRRYLRSTPAPPRHNNCHYLKKHGINIRARRRRRTAVRRRRRGFLLRRLDSAFAFAAAVAAAR
jgi:hypothetical protein